MFFKNMLFKNFFRMALFKKFQNIDWSNLIQFDLFDQIWSNLIQTDPNQAIHSDLDWSPGLVWNWEIPLSAIARRNLLLGGTAAAAWEASLNIDDGRHLTPCLTLWPFISTILLTRATDDPFLFPLISLWAVNCSFRVVKCFGFNCEIYILLFSKVSAWQIKKVRLFGHSS